MDPATLTERASTSPLRITSMQARDQVCAARRRQQARQGRLNAHLQAAETLEHAHVDTQGQALLRRVATARGLSARSQHRILRVARSIADLAEREAVIATDIGEALSLRWEEAEKT